MENTIRHGTSRMRTRFDVEQRYFTGENDLYLETLVISDAPENRCAFVIHDYIVGLGHTFFEFDSLEHLDSAASQLPPQCSAGFYRVLAALPGYIRCVTCGNNLPWFYAYDDLPLNGDIASHCPPDNFEDTLDPDSPTVKGLTVVD